MRDGFDNKNDKVAKILKMYHFRESFNDNTSMSVVGCI